jgi:hypothetical protein
MKKILSIIILLAFFLNTQAQNSSKQRLKVYIDCNNTYCDETFIKTEINIVDFIIDRVAADVHVLVTNQELGNGGKQYQLIFYGLNRFNKITDTLHYEVLEMATDVEKREKLVKHLQIGLAPFIAKSGFANDLTINTKVKVDSSGTSNKTNQSTKDKWNYWVFRAGADGNFSADQNYKSQRFGSRFSANRVTNELKVSFSVSANANRNIFNTGTEKITVKNHSYNFSHLLAKSINQHWTIGYEANAFQSTFSNIKSQYSVSPGIEFNVFPYTSVNSKLLTFRYGLDIRQNQYFDTTIYAKTRETLPGQLLSIGLSLNQKWGSISTGASYHSYFTNLKYYNISFNTFVDVRLTGNLSFNLYAFPSIVRDQLYLPKGDASIDDVLIRRRQLQSNFNFFVGFGVTYRFGSILNNFVNPRFNSNEGGFFFN